MRWLSLSYFLLSALSLQGSSLPSGLQAPASDTENETAAPVNVEGQSYLYVWEVDEWTQTDGQMDRQTDAHAQENPDIS